MRYIFLKQYYTIDRITIIIQQMSVYDQRMNSQSNIYYFQLVPLLLVPLTDSPAPKALIFQLFKNENLCDSSKNPIETLQDGNHIKIPKAFINFNISLLDLDNAPPITLVIESQYIENQSSYISKLNEADFSDENNKENKMDKKLMTEFGKCYIEIKSVIQEFNRNGQRSFDQKIQINQDFQLVFSVYIEKTRFALEKYVRSTREKQSLKKHKNQDNNPFYTNQNKVSAQGRNVEEIVISLKPSKNTPKSSDYALKKSMNFNKNYLTIDQQSAEQRSRSMNREENEKQKENEIEKLKTQSQQININKSQIEDDPLRDIEEDFNHINEEQIVQETYYRNQTQQQEPMIFQMTKSFTEKQTPKRQKIKKQKKDLQTKMKIKEQKRTKKMVEEKKIEKKIENTKNTKANWTSSHALAIALSVFMFLLMINVMSPSRKV